MTCFEKKDVNVFFYKKKAFFLMLPIEILCRFFFLRCQSQRFRFHARTNVSSTSNPDSADHSANGKDCKASCNSKPLKSVGHIKRSRAYTGNDEKHECSKGHQKTQNKEDGIQFPSHCEKKGGLVSTKKNAFAFFFLFTFFPCVGLTPFLKKKQKG